MNQNQDKEVTLAKDEDIPEKIEPGPKEEAIATSVETASQDETVSEQKQEETGSGDGTETKAPEQASGWGWGNWGSIWTSVSTVTESAQAIGKKVSAADTCTQKHINIRT